MGKGGTKYVGDAVGVRKGRHQGYGAKERAKDLASYLETGVRHSLIIAFRVKSY